MSRGKVRSALRAATGAVHERLHQASPFAAIANQSMDIRGYAELLGRIAAFHLTVGRGINLGHERRQLLVRDLEKLGSPAPDPLHWDSPKSRLESLGWAYVVLGSSVGGRVVYRQLDYLFGPATTGRLFFRGSATDESRWRALCRGLEAEGRPDGAVDEIVAGATAAFALFEQAVTPRVAA